MQADSVDLEQQITIYRLKPVDGEILIGGNEYCNLCNCQKLGDEYHYVLTCSSLNEKTQTASSKIFYEKT